MDRVTKSKLAKRGQKNDTANKKETKASNNQNPETGDNTSDSKITS